MIDFKDFELVLRVYSPFLFDVSDYNQFLQFCLLEDEVEKVGFEIDGVICQKVG